MKEPLVAVVTPVFNGSELLHGCIDSVRAQHYGHWRLIVADNASTDGSRDVAAAAARQDSRVCLVPCDEHRIMLAHWNRALSHVPDEAAYVKQLNVDDRLEPGCLRRMVEVAEAHPRVGVVSAYFRYGGRRRPRVERSDVTIESGRDVVRGLLFGQRSLLTHPSALLLRRAAVRAWPDFFESRGFQLGSSDLPTFPQADKEAYFDVLESGGLAFVPEILAELGKRRESATGYVARVGAWRPGRIEMILRHGARFLDSEERQRALRRAVRRYLGSLLVRRTRPRAWRDPEFVRFQRRALEHLIPRLGSEGLGWELVGLRAAAAMLANGPEVPDPADQEKPIG